MKLSDLTSSQLAELTRLIGQKEKLAAQLAAIDAKIEGLGGGKVGSGTAKGAVKPTKAKGRRGPRKGSKPGRLKEAVLAALSASGAGLTIKELSAKLKVKPNNLYSWFYTTGRKVTGLKKAGDKYSYGK